MSTALYIKNVPLEEFLNLTESSTSLTNRQISLSDSMRKDPTVSAVSFDKASESTEYRDYSLAFVKACKTSYEDNEDPDFSALPDYTFPDMTLITETSEDPEYAPDELVQHLSYRRVVLENDVVTLSGFENLEGLSPEYSVMHLGGTGLADLFTCLSTERTHSVLKAGDRQDVTSASASISSLTQSNRTELAENNTDLFTILFNAYSSSSKVYSIIYPVFEVITKYSIVPMDSVKNIEEINSDTTGLKTDSRSFLRKIIEKINAERNTANVSIDKPENDPNYDAVSPATEYSEIVKDGKILDKGIKPNV